MLTIPSIVQEAGQAEGDIVEDAAGYEAEHDDDVLWMKHHKLIPYTPVFIENLVQPPFIHVEDWSTLTRLRGI